MKFEQSSWAALLSASLAVASPMSIRRQANDTAFESKCADLASTLQVENGDVYFTEFVAAGTNLSLPDNDPSCSDRSIAVTADMCRVVLHVATSERSGISMEAWLPSDWSGRFLSTGNGGLGGCIQYPDLAYTTGLGFAAVATNNGHNGTSGEAFYNNEDIVEDFAYRAYVFSNSPALS
jgi:feruloyl esterase